jgi:three-Cys-motif partner protein
LVTSPRQEELRVTLVDGFAGGGVYEHETTKERLLGSPFAFLQTVQEAEALLNLGRDKPLRMAVDYVFVDKARDNVASLSQVLAAEGYGARIGADIQVHHGAFEDQASGIIEFIKRKSPRRGRSLFLLDQYGYKDVPLPLIRDILTQMPASEVILTFNVDSFINFASDSATTRKTLESIGIPDVLRGRTLKDIKSNEKDFRLYIQSCFYRGLVEATGARYYTVFFIRTPGHGDYWLVHLSQHPRARDVMTRVHWANNNHFLHYGGAGIDMFQMLGYHSPNDAAYTGQGTLDFGFDDVATDRSVATLSEQLPHLIFAHEDGIRFGELFATTCNSSPADSSRYKTAIERLIETKEIEAISETGARRHKASTLTDTDLLVPSRQITLFGSGG